jgi:DNA-directed RNA polymerase specialized sigma24 family protein
MKWNFKDGGAARAVPLVAADRTGTNDPPPGRELAVAGIDPGPSEWFTEVARLLSLVGEPNSAALLLIYRERLTQAQAAVRLGVAEVVVKRRVAAGLRHIAQLLTPVALV